jgi:hypothetical protein
MSKGLSRDAAIAICAVLWFESKLNPGPQGVQPTETPGALNPNGAYGIASWNGPRQQKLSDFAKAKILPTDELDTQLWFVLNEAANSYPKTWAAITGGGTYEQIIPVFVADYENPKDHAREIEGSFVIAHELASMVPSSVTLESAKPIPSSPALPSLPLDTSRAMPAPQPLLHDPEIAVMEAGYNLLKGLDAAGRHRVLIYLFGRFSEKEIS